MRLLRYLSLVGAAGAVCIASAPAVAGSVLADVNTDQARYSPGATATIYVDVTNNTGADLSGAKVSVAIKHLGALAKSLPAQTLSLAAGASTTLTFVWTCPSTDFQGYSVEASVTNSAGTDIDDMSSAIDVSSTWTKFPRYGYVSSYGSQYSDTSVHEVWQLKNYHIDGIQFYDWQWKHHIPLSGTVGSPADYWFDLANRQNYRQTVLDLIDSCHGYGMSAMNYNLMYGAWAGYGEDSSGVDYRWGLFNANNGSNQYALGMPGGWAASSIFLFDPSNTSWQNYIFSRESDVFAAYPFDGWHIDNVGGPPNAVYNYSGSPVDVWTTFRGFINNAKTTLNKTIILNNVGGYGLYDVCANSTEDAIYVECWPSSGQTTYADLKNGVDQASSWSRGKGVILPAYMDYQFAIRNTGTFNPPGVLLTDATIFASGGSHLELGDGSQMLDNEYFPNHNLTPTSSLLGSLQKYYDFDVAYENLLRGNLSNNANAISLGVPSSNNATPNTVWTFAKDNGSTHMLNFVNLMGEANNAWRDDNADYPSPTIQSNIAVKYHFGTGFVSNVYWASPDVDNGRANSLTYAVNSDAGGTYISFTLPSLAYWDMVYFTVSSFAAPAAPTGLTAVVGHSVASLSSAADAIMYVIDRGAATVRKASKKAPPVSPRRFVSRPPSLTANRLQFAVRMG